MRMMPLENVVNQLKKNVGKGLVSKNQVKQNLENLITSNLDYNTGNIVPEQVLNQALEASEEGNSNTVNILDFVGRLEKEYTMTCLFQRFFIILHHMIQDKNQFHSLEEVL